ncbi:MAG: hypothetical protein J6U93_07225 [Alistipes sp.]|nr:hypothetical protein [Alistipes sp.]
MKIKNLFYALLALPLFFVACNENTDVDQVKDPTVKVTAGSATETTLQFVITTTDATQVAYLVVEGSDVPTATEVLTNGKTADANVNIIIKEEGLKESTEYVIVAAAKNNKATAKDFITMTTKAVLNPDGPGDEPGDEPGEQTKVEFTATHISTDYTDEEGLHIYTFELGDNTWNSNGWGVDGGTYYSFAIVSATKGNGVLPNGTYSLASSYSANTIINDYSFRYQMENGDMVNGMESFKDANVVITDGKIEANIEMANGDIHHVVYEGALTVGDGGTDVPVEFEATHTADKWYWGGASTYGNKYMVSGEGFSVDVHFPTQYASETALTAQLYTWTSTSWWGYNDFVDFTTRSFTVDGTSVAVDAGTAVVEVEGDVYHIEMTLQGRDGFTYMIEYNGKLNDKGEVGGEEPSAIVFTNFEYVTYNGSSYFYEYKLTNEAGDKMSLRVNDYQANESTILPGTYNWITSSMCGNKGYFSTNNVYVGGVKYDVSGGTLVVAEKETLDLTINLTLASGEQAVFTYAEPENGGNEGGSTEPTEPTKLATPSVFGNVEGNSVVISWQEIEGAKDYTVTLEGVETKTVTNAYISYANLAWETTYNVSVVANPSDEALYIASDAGTTSFTTGVQPEDGGDEGGNEGPVASYEDWVFSATLDWGAKLVTCTDGNHTLTFTLSEIAGATFSINDGSLRAYNVTVNGVATEDATGTLEMSSASNYYIVLDAYINGIHYTGTSTNPVV